MMFKKLDKILSNAENILISLGIITSALIIFTNVVLRYFFNSGLVWAEEFTRYSIIWITFIGGSVAVRNGAHLSVSAFVDSLKTKLHKYILTIFAYLVSISFTSFLFIWGGSLTLKIKETNQLTPAMEMPTYLIYLAIPIGGLLMTIRFIQAFWKVIKENNGSIRKGL